jgi:hypothetical protein
MVKRRKSGRGEGRVLKNQSSKLSRKEDAEKETRRPVSSPYSAEEKARAAIRVAIVLASTGCG